MSDQQEESLCVYSRGYSLSQDGTNEGSQETSRAEVDSIAESSSTTAQKPRDNNSGVLFVGTAIPAMPRRPGASLANPNKAARRVTAVEFASDGDDA